ncbi:uncharacterized protein DNG_08602 [Cephalotrichum gorgonifer]|uniref:Uncharacterized protein n=1 Tax=Cephalotrichum gorgonifer TaxID=2041049 RepID=A0AAE8N5W2_9PEZI|nr:uncharacterized protein DNG_08602 [Cephalotrichum gorgonifer]
MPQPQKSKGTGKAKEMDKAKELDKAKEMDKGKEKGKERAILKPGGICLGCSRLTASFCGACIRDGRDPGYTYYCKSSPRMAGPDGHSHICESHFIRTYLVRVGLLARGMLLRGRVISYNQMLDDLSKGELKPQGDPRLKPPAGDQKPMENIHPAMPSSELQFWMLGDGRYHLETYFSVIFTELLAGLPVKSIESVTYVVDPRSVFPNYHKYVQGDPTHSVYRITLDTKPEQVWALDPCGARMAYEDMLMPWSAFKKRKCSAPNKGVLIVPKVGRVAAGMGICKHTLANLQTDGKDKAGGSGGDDEGNFVEEPHVECLAFRAWIDSWVTLLPEAFGGSMFNIGTLTHADFCISMNEFLAIFGAYVKSYLLGTAYYTTWLRSYGSYAKWAEMKRDGHPEFKTESSGANKKHEDDESCDDLDCCHACDCGCHDELDKVMLEVEQECANRWELRRSVEEQTGRLVEELSELELLKAVQVILVDRAASH